MDQLEFYGLYRQYSTADLINIVRETDNYQVAAVLAAEQLLREREVTLLDEEEADRDFGEKEARRMAAAAKVGAVKAVVADWVEPLARPSAELQPYKWFRIFLVVYGFWYARVLYGVIRQLILTRYIAANIYVFVFDGLDVGWATLVFWLIINRRRWGWILLVVEHAALVIMQLDTFIMGLRFTKIGVDSTPSLYWALFHLLVVGFLCRRQIAELFGVGMVVKRRAVSAGALIGIAFTVIMWPQFWQKGLPGPLRGKPLSVPYRVQPTAPVRP